MYSIHRYELSLKPRELLQAPIDAKFFNVGVVNDKPVVWFETEVNESGITKWPLAPHIIRSIFTGEYYGSAENMYYLGTVQVPEDFHIFIQHDAPGNFVGGRQVAREETLNAVSSWSA